MSIYKDYIKEIDERKNQNLNPKPIDGAELLSEIIAQIKDLGNVDRKDSINFFIYNVLPGTTSAAGVKAIFLKEIILGESIVEEITPTFAFELLSHMKGGPSVKVLLDLALGNDVEIAKQAAKVLKTQVFLYDADTERLAEAFNNGNTIAKDILESYAKAEFFTKLPEVDEKIELNSEATKKLGLADFKALNEKRILNNDGNTILSINEVKFTHFYAWLNSLEKEEGVRVIKTSIRRNQLSTGKKDLTIRAQLVLSSN